jgi:hypothetical protein
MKKKIASVAQAFNVNFHFDPSTFALLMNKFKDDPVAMNELVILQNVLHKLHKDNIDMKVFIFYNLSSCIASL